MEYVSITHFYIDYRCYQNDGLGRIGVPDQLSRDPREDYVQAKTDIHCNEMLAAGDTLSVTNSLFVRSSSGFWDHRQTNQSVCPAATSTTGWVNCNPEYTGAHVMMEVGVNALCEIGSTEDYLQHSYALLTKADGSIFAGSTYKIGYDVFCKGE